MKTRLRNVYGSLESVKISMKLFSSVGFRMVLNREWALFRLAPG